MASTHRRQSERGRKLAALWLVCLAACGDDASAPDRALDAGVDSGGVEAGAGQGAPAGAEGAGRSGAGGDGQAGAEGAGTGGGKPDSGVGVDSGAVDSGIDSGIDGGADMDGSSILDSSGDVDEADASEGAVPIDDSGAPDTGIAMDASIDAADPFDASTDSSLADADATPDAASDASEVDAGDSGVTLMDECDLGLDDCDDFPAASCVDQPIGYACVCPDDTSDLLGNGQQCIPPSARIALSEAATCAILETGAVRCWGANAFGQLGLGDTADRGDGAGEAPSLLPNVELGGLAVQLAAGCNHMCALLADGAVKCWGRNVSAPGEPEPEGAGQLGQGDTDNRGDGANEMGEQLDPVPLGMPAVEVAAGCEMSCARMQDGSVKCWGGNFWGQLGQGHTDSIGDEPGEIDALDPIELGAPATGLSAGYRFVCAQLGSQLKCWGRNRNGQLGQPALTSATMPNHIGDLPGEMGGSLPFIDLGTSRSVVRFAAGFIAACALLDNGDLKCWGGSRNGIGYGEAGLVPEINRGDGPNEMGDFLPKIDLPEAAVAVSLQAHVCTVLADDTLACFGNNERGMLGIGSLEAISDEPNEMGGSLERADLGEGARVVAVRAGLGHTCAILETGELKCFGLNSRGQLGHGVVPPADWGDGPNEMGESLPTTLDLW